MSTVTGIIDMILGIKIRNGKVQPGKSSMATKLYFILLQQIVLRQRGLVPTYPKNPTACDNGLCFSMVSQLLLQMCGPEEFCGDEVIEGVCGCPFFHEVGQIEEIRELIEEVLDDEEKENKLTELFAKLCEMEYETRDSTMKCTIFNTATGKIEKDAILLPCPTIGETYARTERPARKQEYEAPAQDDPPPPARAARAIATKGRPWSEVIGARDVNLEPIEQAAAKSKAHLAHLRQLLETEKKRAAEIERERVLLIQKTKDDAERQHLEEELAAVRAENLKLRRRVLVEYEDAPVVVARAPRARNTKSIVQPPAKKAPAQAQDDDDQEEEKQAPKPNGKRALRLIKREAAKVINDEIPAAAAASTAEDKSPEVSPNE